MTELEELKKQEQECRLQLANLYYYGGMCRAKFGEWHNKYQAVQDKLAVLEIEERVNQV